MITVLATLNSEDLERYRRADSRYLALQTNPRAFGAEVSERIVYEWFVLSGELFEKYGGDADEQWSISSTDGTLYYVDN